MRQRAKTKKQTDDANRRRSSESVILKSVLLAVCLGVLALRTTFTESPSPQSSVLPISLGDSLYTLCVSTLLILTFVAWLVFALCRKSFAYRPAAIEIGLGIFIAAASVAGAFAANKRAATTDFVMLLAPMLMAILLVQILDTPAKIKLVLCIIAALGVVSTCRCGRQLFVENQTDIAQYESDPNSMLGPLHIEPGSFHHMLFEHRLYSQDVRSFFTTSNSAGSFALLSSFIAVGLFVTAVKNRKSGILNILWLVGCAAAVAAAVLGLALTRSKGAIAAAFVAGAMLAAYLLFGKWLKAHRKAVLVVCVILLLAGGSAVVVYGVSHGRVPGGNSMLVRWQYWTGAVKMCWDHPLTGVGGGNFASHYPQYKPDAAIETVQDPHNFLLTILSQYGPLGLVGFLAMILLPLRRTILTNNETATPQPRELEPGVIALTAILVAVVTIILPATMPLLKVIFIAAFLFFAASIKTTNANAIAAALFCGIVGCLIHNLVDYAIFEPGIYTTFWAATACLVALGLEKSPAQPVIVKTTPFARVLAIGALAALVWVHFALAIVPVAKTGTKIRLAIQNLANSHELLHKAARQDLLDPAPLSLNGRFYLHHYETGTWKDPDLLTKAAACYRGAVTRNHADHNNFSGLTRAYTMLAETAGAKEKITWLSRAFGSAQAAVERYPGSASLRIQLAQTAEGLHRNDTALKHYTKAVDIEDSYRRQFEIMYPDRPLINRLGQDMYDFARERIKKLSENQPGPRY